MKAEGTIRTHLRFLRGVQHKGSPFSEIQKHEALCMQQALEWALGHDAMNPTTFINIGAPATQPSREGEAT